MSTTKEFDKYYYYTKSVQSPEGDAQFFYDRYKELKNKTPKDLTEDFCGTFAMCCEWVKLSPDCKAVGYDLDQEPISYGRRHYLPKLTDEQQKRVTIIEKDVLSPDLVASDIICATNFSYFIFRTRQMLKDYFVNCHRRLKDDGLLFLDIFGGSQCYEPLEEETEYESEGFSYFWDLDSFNPINNEVLYHIHFQLKDQPRQEKAFTYHWRMWSIPEVRELLAEAGFSKVTVLWEGSDDEGGGNGEFTPTELGEACEGWIAYLMAEK